MSSLRWGVRKSAKLTAAELPSNEYATIHGFRGGSVVKVYVGKESQLYTIPKEYLCKHSEYFRATFEGDFKEGSTLSTSLEDIEVGPFEDVLKWIGTGNLVLSTTSIKDLKTKYELTELEEKEMAQLIAGGWDYPFAFDMYANDEVIRLQRAQCLDFLRAADYLSITPDPAPRTIHQLESLTGGIADHGTPLAEEFKPGTIERVYQLPSAHPARKFVAQVCIDTYLGAKYESSRTSDQKFKFQKELDSVPGFATDILNTFSEALSDPIFIYGPNKESGPIGMRVQTPLYKNKFLTWTKEGYEGMLNPDGLGRWLK